MAGITLDLAGGSPPKETVTAGLRFTPALLGKIVGCLVILTMGLYYLYSGKERQSVSRMVLGAGLVLASFLLFF